MYRTTKRIQIRNCTTVYRIVSPFLFDCRMLCNENQADRHARAWTVGFKGHCFHLKVFSNNSLTFQRSYGFNPRHLSGPPVPHPFLWEQLTNCCIARSHVPSYLWFLTEQQALAERLSFHFIVLFEGHLGVLYSVRQPALQSPINRSVSFDCLLSVIYSMSLTLFGMVNLLLSTFKARKIYLPPLQ